MMKQKIYVLLFIFATASLFVFTQLRDASTQTGAVAPMASNPADVGCLKCHDGIEKIADTLVMSKLTCVKCHNGNLNSSIKEEAHKGMNANPTDLRVVDKTCGTCHSEDVANSQKSLHATMAGMISGTRYTWAA